MNTKKNYLFIMNAVSYIAVLVVNILAQTKALNGKATYEISDSYLNLFTPAGYVFSIWMIIYLLLGAYIIYQFVTKDKTVVTQIAPFIFVTNLLNILWLLSFHYSTPLASLVVILLLLFFLAMIANKLKDEKLLPKTTFTIYYAWITVASIASVFAFLVSTKIALYNSIWYIILTNIALGIVGLLLVLKGRKENLGYLLTLIWSTIGILVNHLTTFKGDYMSIMIISIVVIIIGVVELIYYVGSKKVASTTS